MGNNQLYQLIVEKDDQRAFEKLYYQLVDKLFYISYHISGCKESSEEIVEDIFIKLWNNRQKMPGIKNIEAFLAVSVRNLSLDYWRKQSRKKHVDIQCCEYIGDDHNPHDDIELQELTVKIEEAIETLPPKCKKIFQLVRIFGLSYKQAAEEMSITPKTVENQLRISVRKILEHLKTEYKIFEKMAS